MAPKSPIYRVMPLESWMDRSTFSCGDTELDEWLTERSLGAHKQLYVRVYALLDFRDLPYVVGYFAVRIGQSIIGGSPARSIAFVELAKFAIRENLQGQPATSSEGAPTVGVLLMISALQVISDVISHVGITSVQLTAIEPKVTAWYKQFGFEVLDHTVVNDRDEWKMVLNSAHLQRSLEKTHMLHAQRDHFVYFLPGTGQADGFVLSPNDLDSPTNK